VSFFYAAIYLKEGENLSTRKPMTADARKAKNEYLRRWRAAHKEKVREYNNRYWNKKAAAAEEQEGGKNE
jgi:hypothetical protein